MRIQPDDAEAPVLIAGGGLVGLTTAMFLAHHGIRSVVIERLRGTSPVPRAAHFHLRTLELFRLAGIEDAVRRRSEEEFLPDGAIVAMDCLAGRKLCDIIASLNDGVEALSPCRRLFVTQPGLEPILRRRAEEGGAQVLEGHEIIGIRQDQSGVEVEARDVVGGATRHLRGRYLVGADGAHSKVREALGIALAGRGPFSNSMTIYFEADLSPYVGGKPLSVIYINNEALGGVFRLEKDCRSGFLLVNTIGSRADSDAADAAKDLGEPRLIELVRSGIGVPDLPVKISAVVRWRATATVADRYRKGRIFLAGDAAHLMPPNGGFGGNTGIHDAHNLAWKLAWVLRGLAGTGLLSTYESERRPVGAFTAEQAYARYVDRTAPYLSAADVQPVAPDFNVELGYLYGPPAIVADGRHATVHGDPHCTRAQPGARAPHIWLEQGARRTSSLDLFGSSFVLLAASQGAKWCRAAESIAGLVPYCVGRDLADPTDHFAAAYGLSSTGAVLIRPDGFVGWRARTKVDDPRAALVQAMSGLLMKDRVAA